MSILEGVIMGIITGVVGSVILGSGVLAFYFISPLIKMTPKERKEHWQEKRRLKFKLV